MKTFDVCGPANLDGADRSQVVTSEIGAFDRSVGGMHRLANRTPCLGVLPTNGLTSASFETPDESPLWFESGLP